MLNKEQLNGLFSSKTDEWCTPDYLYQDLNNEFHFTLDPCSTIENHKCKKFYTKEDDGLSKDWKDETVFVNPPYSRRMYSWIEKCFNEHQKNNITIVCLLPVRTDTKWFHEFIYNKAEIRFIKGRVKFNNYKSSAPFPSMIVIYRRK